MSDDNEWTTVRRRRNTKPRYHEKLRQANIVAASLPIHVLREETEEERERRTKLRAKKKRNAENKKAARSAEAEDDEDEDENEEGRGASSRPVPQLTSRTGAVASASRPAKPPATSKGAASTSAPMKPPPSASKKAGEVIWVVALLVSLIAYIKAMLGLSPSGSARRKSVTKPVPPATSVAGAASAGAGAAAVAKKVEAAAPPAATAKKAEQSKPPAAAIAANARSAASEAKPAADQVKSTHAADEASATMDTTSKSGGSEAKPPPVISKPNPPVVESTKKEAPQAPATTQVKAKPPPACDKDWARGEFLYSEVGEAHADVIAALALSGNVMLSGGYDGALKVWEWKDKAKPVHARNLVGHTGRVEAVQVNSTASIALSTGRDSTIKVWNIANEDSTCAKASYYAYESIKSMAADWNGTGCAVVGTKSGLISLWSLDRGRKTQTLKGHCAEVTCLKFADEGKGSAGPFFSGSWDQTVRLWDSRDGSGHSCIATMEELTGRVVSIDVSDNILYVGDYSSSVKLFDIRTFAPLPKEQHCLANAPFHAGDVCPVAALHHDARGEILASSCIAWWTDNRKALEEAPPEFEDPSSVLNVHATGGAHPEYLYSIRLGLGIVTSMAAQGERLVFGRSNGDLSTLQLVKGGGKQGALKSGISIASKFTVDLVEFSDSDCDEDDENED